MSSPVSRLATDIGGELLRVSLLGEPAPTVDHRYRIDRILGRGASGVVVEAFDERLSRHVALKMAPVDAASRAMLEEARTLAQLQRPPNVIQVYEAAEGWLHASGERRRINFIAMELVRGATLRAMQAAGALPLSELISAYAGVANGLTFMHDKTIAHGDVKPDNVIIDANGVPVLVDLGFASVMVERGVGVQRGSVVGTPS